MRIRFYASQRFDKEDKHYPRTVSSALEDATKQYGDDFEVVHNATFEDVDPDVDVACLWGITGNVREIVTKYVNRNKHAIVFDKALIRHLGGNSHNIFRVGIDCPSPVKYIMRAQRNFDRFERRRIELKPRISFKSILRQRILYCGSSQKYCNYYDLGEANAYAESVFDQVRAVGKKIGMTYRPKPSWPGAREIANTDFSGSDKSLKTELDKINLLITHGSAAAVEAIVSGIPAITLGPCAAQFVAEHSINNETIHNPYFPSDQARWSFMCNLSYCQWSDDELRSGEAWGFIRNEIIALSQ